ncbi:hypothetical protein [Ralstonia pseudosolanacearum]
MRISEFFKDGSGAYSATRLGFVFWVFGVLIVWIYLSITNPCEPQKIDSTVVTLLGILMGGKVVQSFSPNDGPSQNS